MTPEQAMASVAEILQAQFDVVGFDSRDALMPERRDDGRLEVTAEDGDTFEVTLTKVEDGIVFHPAETLGGGVAEDNRPVMVYKG